ncbi:Type II secretory pathway component [Atopomonas sediminilitoris]|uniref:Type II secretory pathway component n=1 Tax=Atopomonas sediminilitoris TaxID=2919919 RepID=UPI001F4D7C71|nr:Type II secretory pathway component [Atopomonas sediminilitoris]MCJ8168402.1 Type II secretory pathway component [Atopomonas sediminilitoris]
MFKLWLAAWLAVGSAAAVAALDPTLPPQGAAVVAADEDSNEVALQLQAIVRDRRGVTRVMINGQTLRVGDSIAGQTLTAIRAGEVVVEQAGKPRVLRLARPVITKSRP